MKPLLVFSMVIGITFLPAPTKGESSGQNHRVSPAVQDDFTVACYYFANYHVDPRNEQAHGPGWTEWELLKRAEPKFPGHQQPKVPAWGYTDEADPKEMARKIDAAADNGIDVFIFDWYYYDDGLFLERGLEKGFMQATNNSRLKFGLMWANHDWLDIHPAKFASHPLQFPGQIKPETWERMTDYIFEKYMSLPSYWKIDGRPYFSVYELDKFIRNFGTIEATVKGIRQFRDKAKAKGFPGLHLNVVMWGHRILPGEQAIRNPAEVVEQLGFDSVTSYVWIHHVPLKKFPETPYLEVMEQYEAYRDKAAKDYRVPYYPNVTMGWDSSPRTVQSDRFINKGYPYMATLSGNTPEAFQRALSRCRDYLADSPESERILTINAWNEWTEGSYLEPDMIHGMAYLEAIKAVFGSTAK